MNLLLLRRILIVTALMMLSSAVNAQFWNKKDKKLLPAEEAFAVSASVVEDQLRISWIVAPDYYMYRDQFGVESQTTGASFGALAFPQGVVEDDPEFGEVVVYFDVADLTAPVLALPSAGTQLDIIVRGQGCNKPVGVCYPPQARTLTVDFDPNTELQGAVSSVPSVPKTTSADTTDSPSTNKFWSYVLAAFGAGILLSFTPCVLPMIPILLGIIAGQTSHSRLRSGWLAVCYVAGTIVVYAIAGWVAGLSGTQLQAQFQSPWVIGFICALLIALALSLFGLFKIQLPSALQTRLHSAQVNTGSAPLTSFVMGLISSLVVGACVSPILIVTLGAAISAGDPVLGASIMTAMGLGMGILLVLVGFGAGWILPKTGAWMQQIQVVFGFMVLAAAIYIASFIDAVPALYLWAALLLWLGYYLYNVAAALPATLSKALIQAVSAATIVWGGLSLIGGAAGGDQILRPLANVQASGNNQAAREKLPFNTVTTLDAAQSLLAQARADQQSVLIDFYADWCLDCKRMGRTTFTEPTVHTALQGWKLVEIDVTETNDNSEALKQYFDVFGPPATLFLAPDGKEIEDLRQYGFIGTEAFLSLINQAKADRG